MAVDVPTQDVLTPLDSQSGDRTTVDVLGQDVLTLLDSQSGAITLNRTFIDSIHVRQLKRTSTIRKVCESGSYDRKIVDGNLLVDHTRKMLYCITPKVQ